MAGYTKELNRARVLYEDHTLLASASVNSGFIRLPAKAVTITKTHTTGVYQLDIIWSMDGVATAFTQTNVTLTNNTPLAVTALAPWAKFTISAVATTFTVHQTTIMT